MSFWKFTGLSFFLSLGDNKKEAEARRQSEARFREARRKAPAPVIERRPSAFESVAAKRSEIPIHPLVAAIIILCVIAGVAWVLYHADILR